MDNWRAAGNVVLIALGCALALTASRWLTGDRITLNESAALRTELRALLGEGSAMPQTLPDVNLSPASWQLCDGTRLGRSKAAGYGGPIELLYALQVTAPEPSLSRLRLLRHQETPGITDFLREEHGWLQNLEGRTAEALDEVSTLSGATITTRAIREHFRSVLEDPDAEIGRPAALSCDR